VKTAGIGYHAEYIEATNPALLTRFFKFLVPILIVYETTVNLAKLSIILFYRRLFPQRSVFWILVATAFILIGTAVGCLIASLLACRPFASNWGSPTEQAKNCFDREAFFIWLSFPNLVTDVIMLVLPMPIMWKLNAPLGIRIGLMATFAVSALYVHTWRIFRSIAMLTLRTRGLAASIVRFVTFTSSNYLSDIPYVAVDLLSWTLAEPGIYLMSACLITYRPLLERLLALFGKATGRTTKSRSTGNSSGRQMRTFGSPRNTRKRPMGYMDDSIALNTFVTHAAETKANESEERITRAPSSDERNSGERTPANGPDTIVAMPPDAHARNRSDEIRKTTNIQMTWEHV
jgi:hypothetical protein